MARPKSSRIKKRRHLNPDAGSAEAAKQSRSVKKMTNAERCRESMKKMRLDPERFQKYLENSRQYSRRYRACLSEEQKARQTEQAKLRMREMRKRKKAMQALMPKNQKGALLNRKKSLQDVLPKRKNPTQPRWSDKTMEERRATWRAEYQKKKSKRTPDQHAAINERRRRQYAQKKTKDTSPDKQAGRNKPSLSAVTLQPLLTAHTEKPLMSVDAEQSSLSADTAQESSMSAHTNQLSCHIEHSSLSAHTGQLSDNTGQLPAHTGQLSAQQGQLFAHKQSPLSAHTGQPSAHSEQPPQKQALQRAKAALPGSPRKFIKMVMDLHVKASLRKKTLYQKIEESRSGKAAKPLDNGTVSQQMDVSLRNNMHKATVAPQTTCLAACGTEKTNTSHYPLTVHLQTPGTDCLKQDERDLTMTEHDPIQQKLESEVAHFLESLATAKTIGQKEMTQNGLENWQ